MRFKIGEKVKIVIPTAARPATYTYGGNGEFILHTGQVGKILHFNYSKTDDGGPYINLKLDDKRWVITPRVSREHIQKLVCNYND